MLLTWGSYRPPGQEHGPGSPTAALPAANDLQGGASAPAPLTLEALVGPTPAALCARIVSKGSEGPRPGAGAAPRASRFERRQRSRPTPGADASVQLPPMYPVSRPAWESYSSPTRDGGAAPPPSGRHTCERRLEGSTSAASLSRIAVNIAGADRARQRGSAYRTPGDALGPSAPHGRRAGGPHGARRAPGLASTPSFPAAGRDATATRSAGRLRSFAAVGGPGAALG